MGLSHVVDFVIPTIGRPSLKRTVESLHDQQDSRWQAFITGDGVWPPWGEGDRYNRVYSEIAPQTASAGLTRNYGLDAAITLSQGRWIGFVDDDDTLEPTYVGRLEKLSQLNCDIIVFQMIYNNGGVLPKMLRGVDPIRWGNVGISFAVRRWALQRYPELKFIREDLTNPGESGNEDIQFLSQARDLGLEIHVDETIQYKVRP